MKPNRDSSALAANLASRLTQAASVPLQRPQLVEEPLQSKTVAKPAEEQKTKLVKIKADTTQVTIRPTRELLSRYIYAAADRSKEEGRIISAQEMMLEVLEEGLKVKK